jgi:acetyl esterase/lipase
VTDLDDAYANGPHIAGAEGYPARWATRAAAFRAGLGPRARTGLAYGPHPRQRLDLFLPEAAAAGLVVFVHGGYWRAFDAASWSHLAAGALSRGWAVAMPSYPLCPEVTIAAITASIRAAVDHAAASVAGPVRLVGHSAGGHLVARMLCADAAPEAAGRIARVLPISGLFDLEPLRHTAMNADFRLDAAAARAESPLSCRPRAGVPVTLWVGGDERPVFLEQSRRIAAAWGAELVIEPDRHHFDVIDGLEATDSRLTRALFA